MQEIVSDPQMIAYCGLYCGACNKQLKGKCPGCQDNESASWCKVRSCCADNRYTSCADCSEFADPNECRKFNNFMSKLFGFIFQSDRAACIRQIRDIGLQGHADNMTGLKRQSIKRS